MSTTTGPAHRAERAPRPAGAVAVVRRLGWGVGDQAISSASNFVLGVVVARTLGPTGFGAFSLAYLTYAFVLNASRGIATDPLVVRFSTGPQEAWRRAVAASSATATAAGVVAGALCLLAGLALSGEVRAGFVTLGLVLPLLMLQDSYRFAFFSAGHPARAFLNDLVWSVLMITALILLDIEDHANVVTCLLVFGLTAGVAALFGMAQCHIRPRPTQVRSWIEDTRSLGVRYLVENVSIGGARQIRFFTLGAVASLAAVGQVRAAEILMGPFLVLLMGISQVAVPEAAQVVARSPRRLLAFCLALGGAQAGAAAAWVVGVLVLLPASLGQFALDELWEPALEVFPIVGLGMVLGGLEIGAAAGVRALGAARRSLRAQLANAALYVVGGTLGAVVGGAPGSCWGIVMATAVGATVWWVQLHRALREHLAQHTDPTEPEGITR